MAAERERQEAKREHLVILTSSLGMTEEEKKLPTSLKAGSGEGIVPTVRLAVNESGICKKYDIVKGDIEFEGGNIGGDWVIQKKDGYPTYNPLPVVVVDHDMQISHVIRWTFNHIANTPKTTHGL